MHKDSFTIAPFQYITVDHPEMTHAQQAARAYSAGCQWVQIRIKDRPLNEIEREVVQALESALAYNAVLIVDDYVSLAEKCKASGVHLGKLDMSPTEARQILGNHCIIGATANTFDDIRQITTMPVDYIGVGPFRFTRTKKKTKPDYWHRGLSVAYETCDGSSAYDSYYSYWGYYLRRFAGAYRYGGLWCGCIGSGGL